MEPFKFLRKHPVNAAAVAVAVIAFVLGILMNAKQIAPWLIPGWGWQIAAAVVFVAAVMHWLSKRHVDHAAIPPIVLRHRWRPRMPPRHPVVAAPPAIVPSESYGGRDLISVTPDYLIAQFKKGDSAAQSLQLVGIYIEKWMRVTGMIDSIESAGSGAIVTIAAGNGRILMSFKGDWLEKLSTFPREKKLEAVGQLCGVTRASITLEHCELMEP